LYNLGGQWQNSDAPGNIMLRPFVKRAYSNLAAQSIMRPTINLWPNPTRGMINLDLPHDDMLQEIRYTIYDISGKVMRSMVSSESQIDVGDMPPGIYFLKVKRKNHFYETVKFVISK
jgi:hypothetical protein